MVKELIGCNHLDQETGINSPGWTLSSFVGVELEELAGGSLTLGVATIGYW